MFNKLKSSLAAIMLLFMSFYSYAQSSIYGKITSSENGEVLIGASVKVEGSTKGDATDIDGNYRISGLEADEYRLVVSYVGFEKVYETVRLSNADQAVNFKLTPNKGMLNKEVLVSATRADKNTPTTFSNVEKAEIEKQNLGQDLPILLNYTPSVVTTSDAGSGVGYTGIRIRGSDGTRINVTVNGIPINDSESHGVFWVNMPDLASSTNNIQVQRGVGTSTNGAAAFGASINMLTSNPSQEAFGEVNNSYGSFNTRRHNVKFNTGMMNTNWNFEGRLSSIHSDGYIDRATSDLQSYYLAGGYYGEKTIIKAIVFGGKERTYQSWYGTPEARLENDTTGMQEVIANNTFTEEQAQNLLNSGRTFNYYLYDNEVDNYQQDHYQLHFSHQINEYLLANAALHWTYGRGYFEQFRNDDDFIDYGLPNLNIGDSLIESTDLIRRRWLDNNFYGFTYSFNYSRNKIDATLGGAYNEYYGDHFGEIIWARFAGETDIRDRYYDNYGNKFDFNTYLKVNYQATDNLSIYGDLQIRNINYSTIGIDSDLRFINTGGKYTFFNPKVGASYRVDDKLFYASVARSNREPVRNDFIDAPNGATPKHEQLTDYELGFRTNTPTYSFEAVAYYMDYKDQLVLTGALNDVGSDIRTNVDKSYRAGIELIGSAKYGEILQVDANLTLSQNKIQSFTEVIYDYGPDFNELNVIENDFENTDISFSPSVIAGGSITYIGIENFEASLLGKYVGRQYLDNTSNVDRSIDPYSVFDLVLTYDIKLPFLKNLQLKAMANNIFDARYVSNGYTFGYYGGEYKVRENYYYPQAGRNYLIGLNLKF